MSNINNVSSVAEAVTEIQDQPVRVLGSTVLALKRVQGLEQAETGERPSLGDLVDRAVTFWIENKAASNA